MEITQRVGKCHCRLPGEPGSKQNLIKSAELANQFIMKSYAPAQNIENIRGYKRVPDPKQQGINSIDTEPCEYPGSADYVVL